MDNKKWSKRFSTIFWWVLAFLPLFTALIAYIGYYFAHLNGVTNISDISNYFVQSDKDFTTFLGLQFDSSFSFIEFTPSFIVDMFSTMFSTIINLNPAEIGLPWIYTFSWAIWVFILHVIFDIIVWLPCFLHDLIDRFRK